MLNKETILQTLRELKPYLAEKYNVKEIGLFGSFADGTETTKSDIDILIDFTENNLGFEFFELENFLKKKFKRKVDLIPKDILKERIKYLILKQTIYA